MVRFGDFQPLCSDTPSYPWCNLFYRQLQSHSPTTLQGLSSPASQAPVGINPSCGIPLVGTPGSLANIANIIACGVSVVFLVGLIFLVSRRKAAVARVEFRIFLTTYLLSLIFNLLTTGALLQQGSTALTVLTAIHAGIVAALFWMLFANAIVALQFVEDGTMASVVPYSILSLAFFAATTYISLDTAFSFTSAFGPSNPPQSLNNIALFVLTSIWPGVAAIAFFALSAYIILGILNEFRPIWFYILSFIAFALAQLAWILLGRVVCRVSFDPCSSTLTRPLPSVQQGSSSTVDGSFIATLLETAAVGLLYLGWRSITEEFWDDPYLSYPTPYQY